MRKVSIFIIILAFSFLLISCKDSSTSPTTTTTTTSPATTTIATTSTTTTSLVKPVIIRETGEGFDRIQQAINAAVPGQHIDVSTGVYEEDLVIDKQLYLTGENRVTTVICGAGSLNMVLFNAGAEGSDIRGFKFKLPAGAFADGIETNISLLTIGRNIFDGCWTGIVWAPLSPGGEICGVLAKDIGITGVYIARPGGAPLVSEVVVEGTFIGIAPYNSSTPSIVACSTQYNDYGIAIGSANPDLGGGASASPGLNVIRNNSTWDLSNISPNPIKAENNYWGYTTAPEIDAHILDNDENAAYGAVDFEPFLTSPPTASLMMKPRLLYASSLFADFFRSLFRSDLPASAMYIPSSLESKIHLARFELIQARFRSLTDERYYPPIRLITRR
jgi:hypothetical protein